MHVTVEDKDRAQSGIKFDAWRMNWGTSKTGLCLLLVLAPFATRSAFAQLPILPEDVRARIQSRITNQYCPGLVVGMINAAGAQYYSFGRAAWDSPEPVNEDSVFEIGSITKTFTCTLLSDMVLKNELALADHVQWHLPVSLVMPTYNGREITLRHLATHTSGLPSEPANMSVGNSSASAMANYTVQNLYDFLSSYELPREPGTQWEYSNLGVGLLGHVLALHCGKDYESLVEERITRVLGLADTGATLTPDQERRFVRGYCGVAPRPRLKCPTLAGGGSLRSTARDLVAFLAANMGLSQSPLYAAMTNAQGLWFSGSMRMGLGWFQNPTSSDPILWHDGSTFGGYCFMGFRPGTKLGVVVLANSFLDISSSVGLHLLEPTNRLDTDTIPAVIPLENLRGCVGRYATSPDDAFDITLQNGHLTFVHSSDTTFTWTLYPSASWSFFVRTMILNANVEFQTNAQGIATSMDWTQDGQTSHYPKVSLPVRLSIQRQNQDILLGITGDTGIDYIVEASTNLAAWTAISTNTIWSQPRVEATGAQPHHRFYRLRAK